MSIKRLNELRQKRGELIHQARQITDTAGTEKRDLSAEERTRFDDLMTKSQEVKADIAREEQLIEEERSATAVASQQAAAAGSESADTPEARSAKAFRSALLMGYRDLPEDERRHLQVDNSVKGGYVVAPEAFVAQLIKDIDDMVFIRGLANVLPMTGAHGIGVPTLDADPGDAEWTSELLTGSEDDDMAFGKRSMEPNPLARRIKVSNNLLMNGAMPIDQIVRQRLAYKFGIVQEKAYLLGDGNKKPLGLFTASTDGIPAGRDVATGNTTTAIGADGILSAKYSLKAGYRRTARWLFHRDAVAQVAKLKDANDQYLWRPGLTEGQPDILAGSAIDESEYVPNVFTSGKYVGMFGDFSHYWILDNMQLSIQVLTELYAETNQTGYIGRYQGDGAPSLAEAFARIKLA